MVRRQQLSLPTRRRYIQTKLGVLVLLQRRMTLASSVTAPLLISPFFLFCVGVENALPSALSHLPNRSGMLVLRGERMGGDSNPRCLSAHTLSRRAQSTALSPILTNLSLPGELNLSLGSKRSNRQEKEGEEPFTIAIAEIIRRAAIGCRYKIRRSLRTRRSPDQTAFCKRLP